jgi:hypothetical protein
LAGRIKAVKKEQKLYLWDWARCATEGARFEKTTPPARSGDVRSDRLDVYRVERLARRHEQPVPPRPAKTNVGARLGKTNHADAIAVGRKHLNAGTRALFPFPRWDLDCVRAFSVFTNTGGVWKRRR